LGTTHEFAQASGASDYAYNTTVDLSGAAAKHVKLTANSNWGGFFSQYGLSEVRFFSIPVFAREPSPDDGATEIAVDVTLGWRAGREAARHDVYLSTDKQAVIDGTVPAATVTEPSYDSSLDLASTYYWRVDEVNDAETPETWPGDVWDFTTKEYLVVEDFESYNDLNPDESGSNRIFLTWIDGYDNPAINGSVVGYAEAPFAEQSIVYGGNQSMPFNYDNSTAGYSEATANVADLQAVQDWTRYGIKTLSIAFYDASDNTGELYVKINNAKVVYDGDPANIAVNVWQTWNIDLTAVDGVQNVTSLSIGVDGADAAGMLYIDDIRLSPQAAVNEVFGDELAISSYDWAPEGFLANTPATPDYWGSDLDMTKLTDGVIAPDYSPSEACAGWNFSSAEGAFGPTLYFDLGSIQSIGGVAIYHQPRYYGFETVKVSVSSLDNPNRVDINDMTDWTGEDIYWSDHWGIGNSGNAPSVMQAVPISQNGRWVRLQFLNWTPGYDTSWTMFSEFKFYSE